MLKICIIIESTILNKAMMPPSAYLFITTLETLASKIRNDSNVKGIKVDNREIKISLLADDITLILLDLDSVKNSLTVAKTIL